MKLFRHDLTVQRANSASDVRLVPAGSATVEVYRQGATVKTGKTLSGVSDTIAIYDSGGIYVNAVLQHNTIAGTTMTVTALTATQLTVGSFVAGTVLAVGDRLVIQATRPSIFTDPAGLVQVDAANQGRAPATGATTGATSFYTSMPTVDVIISGGGLSASQLQRDLSGQMESRVVRLEDFDGYEASLLVGAGSTGNSDNKAAFDRALTYLDSLGGGILELGEGTYYLASEVTVTHSNIIVRGQGKKRTKIFLNTAAGNAFKLSPASQAVNDFEFWDLTFERVSGTPTLIELTTAGADQATFRRVRFNGPGSGIRDDGNNTKLEDCDWEGDVTQAISKTARSGLKVLRPKFRCTDGAIGGNALLSLSGGEDIYIEDFDAEWEDPSDNGVNVSLSGANRVTFMGGNFSGGDGGSGRNAISISSGKGIRFIAPSIHDSAKGIVISGGTGIQIIAPLIVDSLTNGIDVTAGSHIDIIVPLISESNTSGAAGTSHIEVAGTVNHCRVVASRTGLLTIGSGGGSPDFGVDINDGAGTNVMLALAAGLASTGGLWRISKAGTANTKFQTYGLNQSQLAAVLGPSSGLAFGIRAFTASELTPDVEGVSYITGNHAGNITIANFTNGIVGQIVTIENLHATSTITIANGGSFSTILTPIVLDQFQTATFQLNSSAVWRHIPVGVI